MSRFPKISDNQITRYLQIKGFVITQRKGSHITLRNGNDITVVPVGNKKLRIKALFFILLYTNISKESFVDDYENKLIT